MTGEARLEAGAFVARDGARLPLRAWRPEGPPEAVAVALHGFNDYSSAFEDPAAFWAERGIATYAIDQRGFGRAPRPGLWAGTDAMVADLAALAAAVRARHPGRPLYLVGDSMGGAVVMAALARRPALAADGAVLVAPAVWGRRHLGLFKRTMLWLAAHTVPWLRVSARGLDITPSDNVAMLRALAADPLVIKKTRIDAIWGLVDLMDAADAAAEDIGRPVLVLYGTRDEVIPPGPVLAAMRRITAGGGPRTRAALYPEGYHMLLRDLGAETVLADIAAWMRDPSAPLPSGADARAARRPAADSGAAP